MSVQAIIDKLAAEARPPFSIVAGAGDFATAVSGGLQASPAAFVVTLSDDAEPNRYAAGAVDQRVSTRVGVLIGVRNVADRAGAGGAADVETLKRTVRDLLVGWAPAGVREAIELARGRLFGIANGVVWWADEYSLVTSIRK